MFLVTTILLTAGLAALSYRVSRSSKMSGVVPEAPDSCNWNPRNHASLCLSCGSGHGTPLRDGGLVASAQVVKGGRE